MEPHSFLWHYLWVAPHLLQVPLAFFILRRKLHRDCPWFLTYTLYQVIANGMLFALDHSPQVSAGSFHVATNIDTFCSIFLRFAVIYEIFRALLRPYQMLQKISVNLAYSVLLILLAAGLVVGQYAPVPGYTTSLIALAVSADRIVSLVQLGLLLFLFLFSYYFQISWRSFNLGIALGFTLYLAVQLAMTALLAHTYVDAANAIDMGVYHCSVLIWLAYVLAPQRLPVVTKCVPNHQLESWNSELERLLQR